MKILINGIDARPAEVTLTAPGCVRVTVTVPTATADARQSIDLELLDIGPLAAVYLTRLIAARPGRTSPHQVSAESRPPVQ